MRFAIFIAVLLICQLLSGVRSYENNRIQQQHRKMKRMLPGLYAQYGEDSNAAEQSEGGSSSSRSGGDGECKPGAMMAGNPKQKATSIAQKAAQEAKAASDAQQAAGEAASLQVKAQLAEKAMQAAKAAEAALAGKQQIVQQLQQEVREAEAVYKRKVVHYRMPSKMLMRR
ncbi:unnamed protein product [Ceratitis capitata]|uniref:(Mediterranean fruit fly) hypothetical protein n=1 Tax=Ceratitis capitata TaxID=7213 RepID=A0A811UEL4_CERCA|nr:unnamed protein product [Ceratitis capitata]